MAVPEPRGSQSATKRKTTLKRPPTALVKPQAERRSSGVPRREPGSSWNRCRRPHAKRLSPLLAFPSRRFLSRGRGHSGRGRDSLGNLVQSFGGRHRPWYRGFRERERAKQPAPDADLSAFDKLLIGLGIAEAPEAPEYKGNPDTQVWVDLQTALYYCPGSDLYGKTPRGKLTSQRDARLDQFEPAYRKACD